MKWATVKLNGRFDECELKEILKLLEHQNTTDRFVDTELSIKGEYADIDVKIEPSGDFEVLGGTK